MPGYHYQCTNCQVAEVRIGGVDDHLAICAYCGHLMLRLDYDLFSPYFDKSANSGGRLPSEETRPLVNINDKLRKEQLG
jgi:hypothetical protein